MRIFCVDDKPFSEWCKHWRTLFNNDDKYNIITKDELYELSVNETCLFLIHISISDHVNQEKDIRLITDYDPKCYVMRLDSDGLNGETYYNGFVHDSIIPFPNNSSLEHLTEPLKKLYNTLKKEKCAEYDNTEEIKSNLKKAWDEWDNYSQLKSFLHSLSILCQGYLAVYAATDKYKNNEDNVVTNALKTMGWIEKKGNIKEDVQKVILNNLQSWFEEVSTIGWWEKPFGDAFPRDDKLKEECEGKNGDLFNKIKSLENREVFNTKHVAEAYLALHDVLTN